MELREFHGFDPTPLAAINPPATLLNPLITPCIPSYARLRSLLPYSFYCITKHIHNLFECHELQPYVAHKHSSSISQLITYIVEVSTVHIQDYVSQPQIICTLKATISLGTTIESSGLVHPIYMSPFPDLCPCIWVPHAACGQQEQTMLRLGPHG